MEKLILAGQEVLNAFSQVLTHRMFWTCFIAWLVASLLKIVIYFFQHQRIDFRLLLDTGHMPSSHSAFVSSLATVIGLEVGWGNPLFMLALGFAILTMNDAAGVRRAAGHQASILNRIVDDMYQKRPFRPERLKEFLGHTRLEVMTGMLIGVILGLFIYR